MAPQLFAGAMCGGLIVRSTTSPVDDGSLLGAVGTVATRGDLLGSLFSIERSSDRYGIYTVRLYKNGEWQDVVVDDQIPCAGSKPAFGRCGNDNEMWIPLVEKAYAKLHRSFAAIRCFATAVAVAVFWPLAKPPCSMLVAVRRRSLRPLVTSRGDRCSGSTFESSRPRRKSELASCGRG